MRLLPLAGAAAVALAGAAVAAGARPKAAPANRAATVTATAVVLDGRPDGWWGAMNRSSLAPVQSDPTVTAEPYLG
ncbi:hypothetical protein GCM10010326_35630 [Streptomyces xanthochromogenes]|uniref:Uncharacterized protein n=1 Tax=Streptomyces xanthochromogenes TaxID=67384 RepID=A0ABQ3A9W0_9ACTN|nr:hypothetical protein GCM10010326_35630 [Streptomyces xanthochromogenes]